MTPKKTQWLFVTAAKGLQSYVLRSDPMKEMVGSSELIEWLPRAGGGDNGFMGRVLAGLHTGFQGGHTILADASGAVRILFDEQSDAFLLARLWPLLAAEYAPGLEIVVSVVAVETNDLGQAIQAAERELNVNRNLPVAAVPEAGPWVARNRRTGLPATQLLRALDAEDRDARRPDAVDDESARKRNAASGTAHDTLLKKILPKERQGLLLPEDQKKREAYWPLDLTKLTTRESSYIAVIHADANGLGSAMMSCLNRLGTPPDQGATYRNLCEAIENATEASAQSAIEHLLDSQLKMDWTKPPSPIPFRPLVCAGEDFTCIVGAEFAIKFVETYLTALEAETKNRFAGIGIDGVTALTGCAGVVFCNSHFPFSRAYALAESLCGYAKKLSAREASAIAFLRVKSSLQPSDDCEALIAHHFDAGTDDHKVRLTMNPYLVGGATVSNLPRLNDLFKLVKALDARSMPRSGIRELVAQAYKGKAAADHAFERLSLIMNERDLKVWQELTNQLQALVQTRFLWREVKQAAESAGGRPEQEFVHWETPLYDALELLHLKSNLA